MTGRRKEKAQDVKDVFISKDRAISEYGSDSEIAGTVAEAEFGGAARANLGEFVPATHGRKSSKARRKHGRSRGKSGVELGKSTPAVCAGDQKGKQIELPAENCADICDTPTDATPDPSPSCSNAVVDPHAETSNGGLENSKGEARTQGGKDSVLQRLGLVVKSSATPTLSTEELEENSREQADESFTIVDPLSPTRSLESAKESEPDTRSSGNTRICSSKGKKHVLALEAIYGEEFMPFNNEHIKTPCFTISVSVEIFESLTLWAEPPATGDSRKSAGPEDLQINDSLVASTSRSEPESKHKFSVQSLPPLRLVYTLPVSYPSHSPPLFVLSCMWLNPTKLSELCSVLHTLWNDQPGQVVIYSWIEWLQTQSLSHLGMAEKLELGPYKVDGKAYRDLDSDMRASSGCISFDSDISRLLRYNEEKRNEEFCKALHTCYICFTEQLGKDFVKLPCQHIFCCNCMQTYTTTHVKEGSVNKLNCPDTACRGSIPPYILKELLEEDLFQRWEDLVLQRSLDAMMDIVYCPRCETICIEEEDNFVQCSKCFFSFCGICRQTWHVGQECMSAEARLRILQERRKGSKPGEEQRKMEQELINEMMNLSYVRREAKQCPKCKMAISKTEGCNKMACTNCGQYFCFLCGKAIGGYEHFSDGSCRLFEEEEVQRWQPAAMLQRQQALIELELWPERAKACPNCRQLNIKTGNNNHIYCWACRSSYCCLCSKIVRRTSEHYGFGPNKCRQHTAD